MPDDPIDSQPENEATPEPATSPRVAPVTSALRVLEDASSSGKRRASGPGVKRPDEPVEIVEGRELGSNVELQTVNDELRNRNAVLTKATNDLSSLLNSVNLPVLLLSSELTIRHFTPPTQRLMNLRASDVGRPFGEIRLNLSIDDLVPLFTEVLDTLSPREIEVQDRDGRWHLLRVRPYRTTDNKIEGLVVVLVDIDQLRRSQQELRDARDFARSIIASIPLPLVVIDQECKIRLTNEAFCKLARSKTVELEKRFLLDLTLALWALDQPLRTQLSELRLAGGGNRHFEFEHSAPSEPPKHFRVRGQALSPDGEPFFLVTFEDMTAHKEAELFFKAEGERLASQVELTNRELARNREELRALAASLMTAHEDERRKLAGDLHDDIVQRLAMLELLSHEVQGSLREDSAHALDKLQNLRTQLGTLSEDVRRISHRLHPSVLDDLGLVTALRALIEEFGERERMITTFLPQDIPELLPRDITVGLYRIVQEALRNVAKHAGKTHVKVTLSLENQSIRLQVIDFGVGFDLDDPRSGLGFIIMEERARVIGGEFHVVSSLGKGTEITVDVPYTSRA